MLVNKYALFHSLIRYYYTILNFKWLNVYRRLIRSNHLSTLDTSKIELDLLELPTSKCKNFFQTDLSTKKIANWYLTGQVLFLGADLCRFGFNSQDGSLSYDWDLFNDENQFDIKKHWELHRLSEIIPTVLTILDTTNNEKNFSNIEEIICSNLTWTASVNNAASVCIMDRSIKAINLIFYLILSGPGNNSKTTIKLIKKYLLDHAKNVQKESEFGFGIRNNHYLTNITSLFLISYISNCEFSGVIQKMLMKEFGYQIRKDGSVFETSMYYTRLCYELLSGAYYITTTIRPDVTTYTNNFSVFMKEWAKTITKMREFLLSHLHPDSNLPQFGDEDGSHLFHSVFLIRDNSNGLVYRDTRWCGDLIQKTTHVTYNAPKAMKNEEECLCNFEASPLDHSLTRKSIQKYLFTNNVNQHYSYKVSTDLVTIRTRNFVLSISKGNIGRDLTGAHAKNDQGAFKLTTKHISVGPSGTPSYTRSALKRNYFRSMRANLGFRYHSVEPNVFFRNPALLFYMIKASRTYVFMLSKDTFVVVTLSLMTGIMLRKFTFTNYGLIVLNLTSRKHKLNPITFVTDGYGHVPKKVSYAHAKQT